MEGTPQVHVDLNWRTVTDSQTEALADFIEKKLSDDEFYAKFTSRMSWIFDEEKKKLTSRRDRQNYSFSLNNPGDVEPLCKLFADNFPHCMIYHNIFYGRAGAREGAPLSWSRSYAYHIPEGWFDPYEHDHTAEFLVDWSYNDTPEVPPSSHLPEELSAPSFLNDLKKAVQDAGKGLYRVRVAYRRRVEVSFVNRHDYTLLKVYSMEIIPM